MSGAALWLGDASDAGRHERQVGSKVTVDADDLTTHGVIVGMTGSGKTGLGIVVLEEALRSGIPVLAIDLKGDLTNLLLEGVDDLSPFLPTGTDAAAAAKGWAEGLAGWGIDDAAVRQLATGHRAVVYTPGSTAGVPIDLFGSLEYAIRHAPTYRDRMDELYLAAPLR